MPGKEYQYEYETEVFTGLPGGSKIYTGLKFKMMARMQFNTSMVYLMVRGSQYIFVFANVLFMSMENLFHAFKI